MRILSIGNQYPPHHTGGYELIWQSAVAHLRDAGHEVRVLTTDHRTPAPDGDEPDVHRQLRWYWRDHAIPRRTLLSCLRIERHNQRTFDRHVRDFDPEAISWWSMGAMSMSLIERARRAGLPAVAFLQDDWLDYARRTDGWYGRFCGHPRYSRFVERLTGVPTRVDFAAAARYLFASHHTRARALLTGLALYDSGVANSGIESVFLSPAPAREWAWRVLYVGRLDPRKGIDTAIEALAQLPDEAVLGIAGAGDPDEDVRLVHRAAELGLEQRARFLGPRPRSELPSLYAAADAVVFPVVWEEPWGLVPLEAMGIGRPVVATGRGGSGEYLDNERNCLLFEAGDPTALAAQLRRLAGDAGLRERLRGEGFVTAAAHTDAHYNRTVQESLTAAKSTGAPAHARTVELGDRRLKLSVVITGQEPGEDLGRVLAALESQTLDASSFEVIADGREHGWREARAPLVLFIGADAVAEGDLLAQHVGWHERHTDDRDGVLGRVGWAHELELTPFMRWLERGPALGYPPVGGVETGFFHFSRANVSLKRALLERGADFDERDSGSRYEDVVAGYELYLGGLRLLYNRDAITRRLHADDIDEWTARMPAMARAEREMLRLHPELEPRLHDSLAFAASRPPLRGRAPRLLRLTPRAAPWLGRRVWENSTMYFRQQLAPAFLRAWDDDAGAAHQSRSLTAGASASTPSTVPTTRAGAPTAME